MSSLRVTASDRLARVVEPIVASLPLSYRWSTDDTRRPNVRVLEGAGWVDAAAPLLGSADVLLVHDPDRVDPDSVLRLADAADATESRVILSERGAGDPAIAGLVSRGIPGGLFASFAWSTHPAREPSATLFRQVRVLRALGVDGLAGDAATSAGSSLAVLAHGQLSGSDLSFDLLASRGGEGRHAVRLYGWHATVELILASEETARPAHVEVVGVDAANVLPTIYETGHRAAWRRLADGSATADEDHRALEAFAADCRLVAAWT